MVSHYPYQEDFDEQFDNGNRPRGNGIGKSMNKRMEMQEIKQTSGQELAKTMSSNTEENPIQTRTRARPTVSTSTVKTRVSTEGPRSNLNSPASQRKLQIQRNDIVQTPSIISNSDEDDMERGSRIEKNHSKPKKITEKVQQQRALDTRLATPKAKSIDRELSQSLSSRGLLPGPPVAYRQTRELRGDHKQRSVRQQRHPQGFHAAETQEMRMLHGGSETQPIQQSSGVFSKAVGWITGDDIQSKRIEMAMQAIGFYKVRIASLQAENEALKADLVQLRGTNDQFATDLREAQVKSFKEMAKDFWTPLEDRVVEEKLGEIHKELEDWVEENCIDEFEDMKSLSDEDGQALLAFFRKITLVGDVNNLNDQIEIWEKERMNPVLLITSVITHQMYMGLFTNPFLILDSVLGSDKLEKISSAMYSTFEALLCVNVKGAHRWRAELMRILLPNPPAGGKFDGIQPVSEQISLFIRGFCESLVIPLENSPIRAFFKDERPESSHAQLLDCWIRAAEIYVQLQTQLSSIYWPNPFGEDIVGHMFDNRYVQIHRSQSFPEYSNEGKPISLVISPFLALRGNEDGERYDGARERVVCKAVVRVWEGHEFM